MSPRNESEERRFSLAAAELETLGIHGGVGSEPVTGAVIPPVFQSTTYRQPRVGTDPEFTYSRASNPTVTALERSLASFERMEHALAFNSGMAAITALMLGTLESGDHVICSDVVYGGTVRLLSMILPSFGVEASFVDTGDSQAVRAALRGRTKLILLESPGNPTMKIADIEGIAALAEGHQALLAVDNTFLTAAIQRPADLGAHVVVYSTTKYIEGHNTSVGGALLVDDGALAERLNFVRKTTGGIQTPWEAWLTLKGLKTLPLRMRQHSESAATVAEWLEQHPKVTRVAYPFLDSFPQQQLARRQQSSGGGMLSFEVEGGTEAAIAVMNSVSLCTLAENLGAVESLITHPVSMTHGDVPPEEREAAGISDGLIRLSVGLEHPNDIIRDLEQALEAAGAGESEPAAEGDGSG